MTSDPPHKARDDVAHRFGEWQVLLDGTLCHDAHRVTIYPDRLTEGDWWLILTQREWMRGEWNDFIPAFKSACETAGVESVKLKMNIE